MGIEPTVRVLQTLALPLGDVALLDVTESSIHKRAPLDKVQAGARRVHKANPQGSTLVPLRPALLPIVEAQRQTVEFTSAYLPFFSAFSVACHPRQARLDRMPGFLQQ